MTKKKLLIVVGAGASIDFGMPSVWGAGDIINSAAQKYYPLANLPKSNLYVHIGRLIRRNWKRVIPAHLRRDPNFEDVLYTIFGAAAALGAGANSSPLAGLIRLKTLPPFSFWGRGRRQRVDRNVLHQLGTTCVDALVSAFRDRCRAAEREKASEFARLRTFMAALQTEFEIAVVTLNYDNVVYRSLPEIETGFDLTKDRRFYESRIFERPGWPCMLHLHGSVHFDMGRPSTLDMHEIFWQPDIHGTFGQNAAGRSTRSNPEGADFPTSVIVAGLGKTTQILRRPFRTYYSELDRLVSGCDALLFAGYGFGDPHLNIAFERFRDGRARPVVIVGHAARGSPTLIGTEYPQDRLSMAVVHTFHTKLESMASPWSQPSAMGRDEVVDEILDRKDFEVSHDVGTPLAVWYNGILEACDNPDKVIARLK